MSVMLDTNICIDLLRGRNRRLERRIAQVPADNVVISAISVAELWHGVEASSRPTFNEERLRRFLSYSQTAPFDEQAAYEFGILNMELASQGILIGPMDMLISAHALALGATLITDNVREFKRVPGLQIQNWRR
jgi:tRNA(fMet)-specific endonuclease VapC